MTIKQGSTILLTLLLWLGLLLTAQAAPTVSAKSPADGAIWVPVSAPVTVTFSEEMDPLTITANSFRLHRRVGVAAVEAGGYHTVALKGDGTVVGWGDDYFGQTSTPPDLSDVVAIAGGGYHTTALKRDGTIIAWGDNEFGQTTIPLGLSGVVAVAAGSEHTVALKRNGTVVAWGRNFEEQVNVPTGLTSVVAVAAGGYHTVALRKNGTVVVWGGNFYGQTDVPSGLAGVVAIATGMSHTVALKEDGSVVAWGRSFEGQCSVPAGLTGVVAVAAGDYHTVALKGDGTVVAWGDNGFGQTSVPKGLTGVMALAAGGWHTVALQGDGTVASWGYFSGVPTGQTGLAAVAAGGGHSVALKGDGTVAAWGDNYYGQTAVPSGLTGVKAVAAGYAHTTALKRDDTVTAWGWNEYGQTAIPTGLTGVAAVAAGYGHTLALRGDGTVAAWGWNASGQTSVPAGLTGVSAVAAGHGHSVALKKDGSIVAWGDNAYGQAAVPAGLAGMTAIAAGDNHTVALKQDGTVVTWGDNTYGQAVVPAGLTGVVAVAAGGRHTVAFKGDGSVVAWGSNEHGQTEVPLDLTGVAAIAAGGKHSVALKGDGTIVAWGWNYYGQASGLSQGDPSYTSVPATLTYAQGTRTAALSPVDLLLPQSLYRTDVFGRSLGGEPVAGKLSWLFSTGETLAASLVLPVAGLHGKIVPAIGQLTLHGSAVSLALSPDPYYEIDSVTGCNGALDGTTYTTAPVDRACRVTATFRQIKVEAPGPLTVPASDTDGAYLVTWSASPTVGSVAYTLQEATNATFTAGVRAAYTGTALSARIVGRSKGVKYYYRVKATKPGYSDSSWSVGANGCGIPCAPPGALTIPGGDADGSYPVKWAASPTPGVTYTLQEATNSTFTIGVRAAYTGTAVQADISGRVVGTTYYYRVKASKSNVPASVWKVGGAGCAVPGATAAVAPATVTVPASDADGAYSVSWSASTTSGVIYTVQEATNAAFTANLRTAYAGTALKANITARTPGMTYYYRVRAMKPGLRDSPWKAAANGCRVGG